MTNYKKTILLVDDNLTLLMYVGILIKRIGYDVFIAKNGAEALKMMKEKRPSLVLLDVTMPVMDGKTCLSLAKNDPDIKDIPVFMLTGTRSDIQDMFKIGCNGFLKKPINLAELYEAIQNTIEETPRQNIRTNISIKVDLAYENKKEELFALNLSEEGIYLRRETPLDIGTTVAVTLPIPNAHDNFTFKGSVIFAKSISDNLSPEPGIAVRFDDITHEERTKLRRIIYDQLVKDLLEGKGEDIVDR